MGIYNAPPPTTYTHVQLKHLLMTMIKMHPHPLKNIQRHPLELHTPHLSYWWLCYLFLWLPLASWHIDSQRYAKIIILTRASTNQMEGPKLKLMRLHSTMKRVYAVRGMNPIHPLKLYLCDRVTACFFLHCTKTKEGQFYWVPLPVDSSVPRLFVT